MEKLLNDLLGMLEDIYIGEGTTLPPPYLDLHIEGSQLIIPDSALIVGDGEDVVALNNFYVFLMAVGFIETKPYTSTVNGETVGIYNLSPNMLKKLNTILQTEMSLYEMVTGDPMSHVLFNIVDLNIGDSLEGLSKYGTVVPVESIALHVQDKCKKGIVRLLENNKSLLVSTIGDRLIITNISKLGINE